MNWRVFFACVALWAGMNLAARLIPVEPIMLDPVELEDTWECEPGMDLETCLAALDDGAGED